MENKQIKCVKGESCLHCGSNYCRFVDELEKLKAKNEEFKAKIKYMEEYIQTVENARNEFERESKFLKEKLVISSNSDKKTLKIIQTLTEIKGIAEKHKVTAYCDYLTDMDNILQKISEVEDV